MAKKLTAEVKDWYFDAIESFGGTAVSVDRAADLITYNSKIASAESHVKSVTPEELAHATLIALLHGKEYKYPLSAIGHEMYFAHGSKGSKSDEVDVVIRDPDGLPYALIELKAATEFERDRDEAIKLQLFGTAPLTGSPKLLVYAIPLHTSRREWLVNFRGLPFTLAFCATHEWQEQRRAGRQWNSKVSIWAISG